MEKNAKIYYRIFPSENMDWENIRVGENRKDISIRHLQDFSAKSDQSKPPEFWEFTSSGIFINDSQSDIYESVKESIPDRVCEGCNAIITAFGQTGTGKSLTIAGLQYSITDRGLAIRCINDFLKHKSALEENVKMVIEISYIEISKNYILDLLESFPTPLKDYNAKSCVRKVQINSEIDALEELYKAEGRKDFSKNASYYSHTASSIFTIYISKTKLNSTNPVTTNSRLHLIDLAGVDTIGNLSCLNKNHIEIGRANLMKSEIEQFLLYLHKNNLNRLKIKQRMNPLIHFLGDDLSNSSILRCIGHLRISKENLFITLSMLRFGQLVSGLRPAKKKVDCEMNDAFKIKILEESISKMRNEKQLENILLNQNLSNNLTQERMEHIQRTIEEFIKNKTTPINIINVADVTAVLQVFRKIHLDNAVEKQNLDLTRAKILNESHQRKSKSSIKSKERLSSIDKLQRTKTTSDKSISINSKSSKRGSKTKKKTLSKISSQVLSLDSKRLSKIRSASGSLLKRSSQGKRKSITSTSAHSEKVTSTNSIQELPIPEILPEFKEAWSLYVKDDTYLYKMVLDDYVQNEGALRTSYADYLAEIEEMQKMKKVLEIGKQKITELELLHKFNSDGGKADLEKACQEQLSAKKMEHWKQQEKVLKAQSQFKIYLNVRQGIKERLNEDFTKYCKVKFSSYVPNLEEDVLDNESDELLGKLVPLDKNEEHDVDLPEPDPESLQIRYLKSLMRSEIKLKENYIKKHTYWINKPCFKL